MATLNIQARVPIVTLSCQLGSCSVHAHQGQSNGFSVPSHPIYRSRDLNANKAVWQIPAFD